MQFNSLPNEMQYLITQELTGKDLKSFQSLLTEQIKDVNADVLSFISCLDNNYLYYSSYICQIAAEQGLLEIIIWFEQNKYYFDHKLTFEISVRYGHTHIMDWIDSKFKIKYDQYFEISIIENNKKSADWFKYKQCKLNRKIKDEILREFDFETIRFMKNY